MPLAPLAVTLSESVFAYAGYTSGMLELHMSLRPFRAGEQSVHAGKDVVTEGDEVVLERYAYLHVQGILAVADLQLLSYGVLMCIFSQIPPMVKSELRDLPGILLVSLYLADCSAGTVAVDHERIDYADKDTMLM